jgi:hypothetical protein
VKRLSWSFKWVIPTLLLLAVLLLLPMPLAERYTSPTQDGQYLLDPLDSYRFLAAVARVSSASKLGTSGAALKSAKQTFLGSAYRPTEVHLLFFPERRGYTYITREHITLSLAMAPQFVWEVWGVPAESGGSRQKADVLALLDYESGSVLARLPETSQTHSLD